MGIGTLGVCPQVFRDVRVQRDSVVHESKGKFRSR